MVPEAQQDEPPALENLVSSLRADASLRVFLDSSFNPQSHLGQAVREDRVSSALEDAQRASSLLTANVRKEVIRRKEALLAEVEAVDALEKEVQTVSQGVQNLTSATAALSDALQSPFQPMDAAMCRMTNLCAAANLLRAVARFRFCTSRLQDAGLFPTIGPASATTPANLPAAAEAIKELEQLASPSGPTALDKVDGIAKHIIAVRKASPEVRKRATAIFKSGLATRNQIHVEAAVSAFASLNILTERVNSDVSRLLRETQTAIHRGLEAPAGANLSKMNPLHARSDVNLASVTPTTANLDVWAKIDKMLETVAEACCKAILLQQVMSRKYCEVSHMSLLHDTIASNFIDSVSRTLTEQVTILSRTRLQRPAAAYVFLALAEGYPRLKSSLIETAKRVSTLAHVSPTPITKLTPKLPLIPDYDFIQGSLFSAVVDIETHYLTASLERLTVTVTSFFEGGKYAGETEALELAKMLSRELTAARSDKQLFRTAINNVATALRLYTSHTQDHAAATVPDEGPHGSALGEAEEWHLTSMYNGMVVLSTSASRVLGEREDGSGPLPEPIAKEVTALSRLSDLLLDGPFSRCRSNIQTVMKRMHTEDLESVASDDGCSVYVLDIAAQLSMFADGIIPELARSRSLGTSTLGLATWVLDSFLRNVALVFPVPEAAKIRLTSDMARIEMAVESLCAARMLGRSYHAFRALRTALLLPTEAFVEAQEKLVGEMAPLGATTVGHLLFSRSIDGNLQHPHRRQDIAPDEYVHWLETHSEEESWKAVEESLSTYRENTKVEDLQRSAEYEAITSFCGKLRQSQLI